MTPAPELSWLPGHPHTPNTRNQSLLYCTVPEALTSLPMLFRGCGEKIQPSSYIYEAPKHTKFIKHTKSSFPLPYSPKTNHSIHIAKSSNSQLWGRKANTTEQNRGDNLGNTQLWLGNLIPESFLALSCPKRLNRNPQQPKFSGETNNDFSAAWGNKNNPCGGEFRYPKP